MAFDPASPTFYGSCLQVQAARVLAGVERHTGPGDTARALTYLYNDTDHAWFEPGDRVLIGFFPDPGLLTLDDPVVFSVVVELREDSTGSFRLSAGADPTWDLTDPSVATESLGTFDASGTSTAGGRSQIVIPVTSWTGAMIYDGSLLPVVHLEALTGVPRILQVRVRMWPPGGALGAWENDPDYQLAERVPRILRSTGIADMAEPTGPTDQVLGSAGPENHNPGPGLWGGFDDYGDTDVKFSQMLTWLYSHGIPEYAAFTTGGVAPSFLLNGSFDFWWTVRQLAEPTHDWTGRFTSGMAMLIADPTVASFRESGPSFPDPDRVPGESSARVRDGSTGGTLKSTIQQWTGLPELLAATNPNDALVSVSTYALADEPAWLATATDTDSGVPRTFYLHPTGLPHGSTPAGAGASLIDLPPSPVVVIEVDGTQASGSLDGFDFDHVGGVGDHAHGDRTVDYSNVRSLQRFQNVQWFNPAGVSQSLKPRFYVKHRDDSMRPVGFGKPATEPTVFRVPGRGRWRDLTTAEYATYGPGNRPPGGMGLKVKRQDGSGSIWWDHVGWCVPDA